MTQYLIIALAAFMFAPLALAQGYTETYNKITDMNRVKPLQNPGYERTYEILGRKIQSSKTRVVGRVQDVLLTPFGQVTALNVDLDRLRLGSIVLGLEDANIQASRDAYVFSSYDREQIENLFPQFLANIQTAAGEQTDIISLNKLTGATLKTPNGDRIGKVKDVLFSSRGDRAEAIYVNVKYKTVRNIELALPFGMMDYSKLPTHKEITIPKEQASALIAYAEDK